ncbi:MAG: fibronectin/fibrinogen-binding protein [Syntrophothermus sp.]|uniref:Rqc2 family fibronectin-binding protein n=1 Tax=Syntrophothermus sp. TaxID=2736299 RepID=UPI00257F9656|nr:NFACT RNA binding domain-containing protein [Syntrophothermus sp.]NSW82256.1 fibronectin/fibrinogen-binding protein [Syntrophothermus sp.]
MPFDGLTIAALCEELNPFLQGCRIDKILQPEKDEIVLSLRKPKGSKRLVISANPGWSRLHLTDERKENPATPFAFCMLLRKHLDGARVKEIVQVDSERVVNIRCEALNDFLEWKEKVLVCEFTGKHTNIILMDPETNLITDALKRFGPDSNSYREILPGHPYVPPPAQGKLEAENATYEEFAARLWETGDSSLNRGMFRVCAGISQFTARYICHRSGLDPDLPTDECGELELSKLFLTWRSLWEHAKNSRVNPTVLTGPRGVLEFSPFSLLPMASQEAGEEVLTFASVNQAVDYYFYHKLSQLRAYSYKTNLLRTLKAHLEKAYRKALLQEGDLVQAEKTFPYRTWGELLTAYGHQIEKGQTEVELIDFYTGESVTVELLPHLTPIENAQRYFKLYAKGKAAALHAEKRLRETRQEIAYLESAQFALEQAETMDEIEEIAEELDREGYINKDRKRKARVKEERLQPRMFPSSDGYKILVGRNNLQNEQLTLKASGHNDLWLHAKDVPGSHVIVRLSKNIQSIHEVPDHTLEEAALLAAYFSKSRESDKVAVDYTFRNNVKKPKGSKPGMVVYDNYWTLYVNLKDPRLESLLRKEFRPEIDADRHGT